MASALKLQTADGRTFYRLEFSRGRGKSKLTKRWFPTYGWSQKAIDRELQRQLRQFESDCESGVILSRADKKAKEEEARQAALRDPTVAAYYDRFIKAREPVLSFHTMENYRKEFGLRILPAFGEVKLSELKPGDLNAFFGELSGKFKYNSVKTCFKCFRAVVRQAYLDELINRDPFVNVSIRKSKDEVILTGSDQALTEEDLVAFLDGLEEEPLYWRTFFRLALDSGCRRAELCGLRWEDINWRDRTLTICRSALKIPGQPTTTTTPKTVTSARVIDMGQDVLALLKEHQQDQASNCLSPWIFPSRRDPSLPLSPTSAETAARRLRKRTGIDGFHLHGLRHTSATMSILGGADVASVSRRLGHSSPSITLGTYTHPSTDSIRQAGNAARQAIKRARKEPTDKAN